MKRKMLRKLLASLAAATMLMSMAACGNQEGQQGSSQPSGSSGTPESNGGSNEATPAPTEEPEEDLGPYTIKKDANGNPIDLGGMHIVLRDWSTDPDEEAKKEKSAFEEARIEYREWLQKTYNFTFEQKAISTWESTPEDFVNYVTTGGDDNNYIFMLYTGSETQAAMKNGLMYDISTLDCFDMSEDKWHHGVSEMFSLGSQVLGFRHNEGVGGRVVYFNKRILRDAGIDPDDLYKWEASGDWTWDKFEEICSKVQKDTDNDGVDDVYGMACRNTIWYEIITHSNYGCFVDMDDNGMLVSGLEYPETMEALNWALKIWDTYDAHQSYPEDAAWDYFNQAFMEGKGCFYPAELWRAGGLTGGMDDELGVLCFPKGPKADDYVNPVADNPTVIPACYDPDRAWKIAFAFDVWTDPVPEYEDYATWKSYDSYDDTEAVDVTLSLLMNRARPTYNSIAGNFDLAGDIFYQISKDNTPAQLAESLRNAWQAKLDEANGVAGEGEGE